MAWVLLILGVLLGIGGFVDLSRPVPKWQESTKTKAHLVAWGLFGLGALMAFAGLLDISSDRSAPRAATVTTRDKHDSATAWVMCQGFVNERLLSPGSAKYPVGNGRDYTTHLGNGTYRVQAYVDSQNAIGVLLRTKFDCSVSYSGPDRWRLERIALE